MDFLNKFYFTFIFQKGNALDLQLSDIADIAQVFIALINIGLVIFIIRNDIKKTVDAKKDDNEKNLTSIKLQGFKEFVVAPNFVHLQDFFNNLLTLKQLINSPIIEEDLSLELNKFIKSEASKFRLNFNDAILNVNRPLFDSIKSKIEDLSDLLITVISDCNYDLTDVDTFALQIATPINYTKSEIVALLITYKGD